MHGYGGTLCVQYGFSELVRERQERGDVREQGEHAMMGEMVAWGVHL